MLMWTIICFIGAVTSGFFAFRTKKTCLSYIAKLMFYIFLFGFLFLLIATALGTAPPPMREPMPAA